MSATTFIAPRRRARSPALRRLLRHRLAMFGLAALVLLILTCAIGPYFTPYDALSID